MIERCPMLNTTLKGFLLSAGVGLAAIVPMQSASADEIVVRRVVRYHPWFGRSYDYYYDDYDAQRRAYYLGDDVYDYELAYETYGHLSDRAFLRELYARFLGRAPDRQGFNYWLDKLQRGVPRHEIVYYIRTSRESIYGPDLGPRRRYQYDDGYEGEFLEEGDDYRDPDSYYRDDDDADGDDD
jgi:hypothetical protein